MLTSLQASTTSVVATTPLRSGKAASISSIFTPLSASNAGSISSICKITG
uniref:Uncharacterized protein n=1 Tax=Medicago truncatula TaxID=3880 RepID=I3SGJ9_MEDTR|nr:unknown [Medicago truncatula]